MLIDVSAKKSVVAEVLNPIQSFFCNFNIAILRKKNSRFIEFIGSLDTHNEETELQFFVEPYIVDSQTVNNL